MKYLLILFFPFILSEANDIKSLEGIWIPRKINWKEGTFKTFYFTGPKSFVIISSTQKMIKDSIYFQSEPGYTLTSGVVIANQKEKAIVNFQTLYKYIVLPGEKIPGKMLRDSIQFKIQNKKTISFEFRGVTYIRTPKYTVKSVNSIHKIESRTIPGLKKEFGLMN